MSNIKELIRDEIRKWQSNIEAKCPESTSSRNYTKEEWNAIYEYNAYTRILSFIDTLPDEPITSCNKLAEAAMNYIAPIENEDGLNVINFSGRDIKDAFIAGAEWQKKQIPMPEDTVIFQKGVEEGKRLMMEGATYNELMELYMAIRDEIIKRHRDAAVNIKEKTMDLKEDTGNESALHQIRG